MAVPAVKIASVCMSSFTSCFLHPALRSVCTVVDTNIDIDLYKINMFNITN